MVLIESADNSVASDEVNVVWLLGWVYSLAAAFVAAGVVSCRAVCRQLNRWRRDERLGTDVLVAVNG